MKKEKKQFIICVMLILGIIGTFIHAYYYQQNQAQDVFSDGIEQIDLDTIYLSNSGVKVTFSEVIVGKHEEVRKLIVSTQEATVSTELSNSLLEIFGFKVGEKKQTVSYTGKGYFVVDLDNLSEKDVIVDEKNKIVTINIGHAYLQTLEINPNNVIIDEVQQGLLAWGDIKLTVKDYNEIEKQLVARMSECLNTAENAQEADDIALQMVKEIYEPIIKAMDSRYKLEVKFK